MTGAAAGSGVHIVRIRGYVYCDLVGLHSTLGPAAVTAAMLRDWVRRDLLRTDEPHAPGHVRQGRRNLYRLDVVAEVEWVTRHRTKPRSIAA